MARRRAPPAPVVFLDASFFLAAMKDDDACHAAAARWARHYDGCPQITTTLAMTEAANKHPTLERWRRFETAYATLRADPGLTVVSVDVALLDRAMAFRQKHPTRTWGLADCVSFVVMRDHGVTDALSADKHFNEAGFDALLLRP